MLIGGTTAAEPPLAVPYVAPPRGAPATQPMALSSSMSSTLPSVSLPS